MTPNRIRRASAVAALGLVSVLGLAACGSSDSGDGAEPGASNSSGVSTIEAGKLKVCTHLPYKPFQFKEGSEVVGFDVELMDLVAKKLGLEQEIVDISFDQITSGAVFAAKKCDAAAAGTTITDERAKALTFSEPYFDATQALITKKGSGFTDLASLKGKKVGVQTDTTGQQYAEENKAANGYTVVVFDDLATEMAGVLAGRVDAAINDNGVVNDYVKDNPSTEVVTEFDTGEQYGLMFPKTGSEKLVETANEVLKASKEDGSYNEIYKKWFGVDAPK
ncbi:amino acid ABC transporter substrate-binding protein (PAAT family) [Knoellia remsis]|uniref:Amino acid ABC transporter substrate-binding protein (PAAT family) n=1 Tax=Knoellia remsis TaxID=407159 RepID=A0A2T0UQY1_9MICO|nr:transporter substrate-binding domain-containing protein [Knoellia remsis]PRY60304.1 amino acid ABC transporter substrate-binding protein (PAAT family) [Knoellia remsis]